MRRLISFFGLLAILVIIFGTLYAGLQHLIRSDANIPQIQLAEDAGASLDHGTAPAALTHDKIDISKSLTPFLNIYDLSGKMVAGSGYLDGGVATPPNGVLEAADNIPHHIVTWQPRSDVRIAAVTVRAHNYYVLSGRSLREVEQNEDTMLFISLIGGGLSLLILCSVFTVLEVSHRQGHHASARS